MCILSESKDIKMDPNDAGNYRCVFAKNGARQYFFGKERIAVAKIPKIVLPSIICPGKAEALVSERTATLEKRVEKLKKGVAKAEAKKAARKKKSPKKSPPKEKTPPKVSPKVSPKKGVKISSQEKPQSAQGKGPVGKGGLKKCGPGRPKDYDFLRFYWEEERKYYPQNVARLFELVQKFEKEYGMQYPYEDREQIFLDPTGKLTGKLGSKKSYELLSTGGHPNAVKYDRENWLEAIETEGEGRAKPKSKTKTKSKTKKASPSTSESEEASSIYSSEESGEE